jgi:DnaJ-class molecular chaperone
MDGYYEECEECAGEGQVSEYDMIRDEVFMSDCRLCNGAGELFVESEE